MIEIIPKIPLKQIPQGPNYLAGIMNYGGETVPVIDFSVLIAERPSTNRMHTRIMLFKNPQGGPIKILGLIAEKIIETRALKPQHFSESGLSVKKLPFLEGVYNTEQENIQRINIDQIFTFLQHAEKDT